MSEDLFLVCTSAVRNCLECREKSKPKTPKLSGETTEDRKAEHIQSLIGGVQPTPKVCRYWSQLVWMDADSYYGHRISWRIWWANTQ